jgi:aminoacyl-tRNA hydrolase
VKLIVGLGNPGLRYARTRHNAGFDTVDIIAAREGWSWDARKARSLLASGFISDQKVTLAKPQTYMNDSGLAVGELVRFYKLDLADLLVISDDLDLPAGKIRLRPGGSAGGQHGLESITFLPPPSRASRSALGAPPTGAWKTLTSYSARHTATSGSRCTPQASAPRTARCAGCQPACRKR